MKKIIIILSIVFVLAGAASAVLAGYIYHQKTTNYTVDLKENLSSNQLKNIEVHTPSSVTIEQTTKQPYVTVTGSQKAIYLQEPAFTLDVKEQGATTYITVEQTQYENVMFQQEGLDLQMTLYLPKQSIDRLVIESKRGYNRGFVYHTEEETVKYLEVKQVGYVKLSGNYEEIAIETTGNIDVLGNYQKASVVSNNGDIYLKSKHPSEVVAVTRGGNISLEGQFKIIDAENEGKIVINSDTLCEANITADSIKAKGLFEVMHLRAKDYSEMQLALMNAPKKISIIGNVHLVDMMLPTNIKGFELRYLLPQDNREEQELDSSYKLPQVLTDFEVDKTKQQKEGKVLYLDASTKILIQSDMEDVQMSILDSGKLAK